MIIRIRPRHTRACQCGHPCHQRGPYQPVRWCTVCLKPIRRHHRYKPNGYGGLQHRCCEWPKCSGPPEAYIAMAGRAMFNQMRDLLYPGWEEERDDPHPKADGWHRV